MYNAAIMKRTIVLLAFGLAVITAFVAMFVIADTPTDNTAEFFFTRLAYSENGFRGFGRFVSKNFR